MLDLYTSQLAVELQKVGSKGILAATLSQSVVPEPRHLVTGKILKSSRLPAGYTEKEYITFAGRNYIDTGLTTQINTTLKAVTQIKWTMVGTALELTNGGASFGQDGSGNYNIAGETTTPTISCSTTSFDTIEYDSGIIGDNPTEPNQKLTINGANVLTAQRRSSGLQPIYIGNIQSTGRAFACYAQHKETLVYVDDVLVGDFVPCDKHIEGAEAVEGMYDLITNTFKQKMTIQ